MRIRPADPRDAEALTELAHASKAHWGYPRAWLERWRNELTFTASSFEKLRIHCAEREGRIVGVCAIEARGQEPELEHLWVHPSAMRQGIGRELLAEGIAQAREHGARRLRILSDPFAKGFYIALGARQVGELPSKIDGRSLPCLELEFVRGGPSEGIPADGLA